MVVVVVVVAVVVVGCSGGSGSVSLLEMCEVSYLSRHAAFLTRFTFPIAPGAQMVNTYAKSRNVVYLEAKAQAHLVSCFLSHTVQMIHITPALGSVPTCSAQHSICRFAHIQQGQT